MGASEAQRNHRPPQRSFESFRGRNRTRPHQNQQRMQPLHRGGRRLARIPGVSLRSRFQAKLLTAQQRALLLAESRRPFAKNAALVASSRGTMGTRNARGTPMRVASARSLCNCSSLVPESGCWRCLVACGGAQHAIISGAWVLCAEDVE